MEDIERRAVDLPVVVADAVRRFAKYLHVSESGPAVLDVIMGPLCGGYHARCGRSPALSTATSLVMTTVCQTWPTLHAATTSANRR